jgi:hypothetical protein
MTETKCNVLTHWSDRSGFKLSAISVGDNCAVVPFVHMMSNYRLCQIIFNQRHLLLFLQYHMCICFYTSKLCVLYYTRRAVRLRPARLLAVIATRFLLCPVNLSLSCLSDAIGVT